MIWLDCRLQLHWYRISADLKRWHGCSLSPVFDWAGHVGPFAKWAPKQLAYKLLVG